MAVDDESVPPTPRGVMAEPDTDAWSPGEASDTVLVTVQVNDAWAE